MYTNTEIYKFVKLPFIAINMYKILNIYIILNYELFVCIILQLLLCN